jgi:hypothetical protein
MKHHLTVFPTGYTGPLPTPSTKPDEAIAIILKAMSTNDKVSRTENEIQAHDSPQISAPCISFPLCS